MTTLNPADKKNGDVVLSNGNLTVTGNDVGGNNWVRSTDPQNGKVYVEFSIDTVANTVVGIADAGISIPSYIGSDDDSFGLFYHGFGSLNGNFPDWETPYTTGDIVGMAIDLDNKLVWWRVGSGAWNGSVTADPETGTEGIALGSDYIGTEHLVVVSGDETCVTTVNFGATSYANPAPVGFGPWENPIQPVTLSPTGGFGEPVVSLAGQQIIGPDSAETPDSFGSPTLGTGIVLGSIVSNGGVGAPTLGEVEPPTVLGTQSSGILSVGDGEVADLKHGTDDIARAYLGGRCVWPPDSVPLDWPLVTLTDLPPGTPEHTTMAWWRADAPDTFTLSGDKVVEWRDVANGYAMGQSVDAQRPTFEATGFGGTPGVRFDKSAQQFLEMLTSPWPIDRDPAYFILVVDTLSPPSDTTKESIVSYGNELTVNPDPALPLNPKAAQRKLRREVLIGYNRATIAYGNGFTEYAHMFQPVMFWGRHAIISYLEDVNTSLGVDDVFAGLMTQALRTVGGRTRLGADSMPTPGEFADCIIRDVVIGHPGVMTQEHWENLQQWIQRRRKIDFLDNFMRIEQNLDDSPDWTLVSGVNDRMRVVNNQVIQTAGSVVSAVVSPDVGSPDQYVQGKFVSPLGEGITFGPRLALRVVDSSNIGAVVRLHNGDLRVYKTTNNNSTLLGTFPYTPGDIVRLDARGTDIRFYSNGELLGGPWTVTEHATATRSGVVSAGSTSADIPLIEEYENAI